MTLDERYYINAKEIMDLHYPKCNLPRPAPRLLTGDNEFLNIILVDTDER